MYYKINLVINSTKQKSALLINNPINAEKQQTAQRDVYIT